MKKNERNLAYFEVASLRRFLRIMALFCMIITLPTVQMFAETSNELNVSQQQQTVTGQVTDSYGETLPGVTVVIKRSTKGTTTDENGNYTLTGVSSNATLQFSFVGLKTSEVLVGNQTRIDVVMEEESIGLAEVVAVAYGTSKRKDLTGAISTVDSDLISRQSASTVTKSLEGAVAGLQVAAVDGQPGLDMGIRLRGVGSASQNNSNALIVVDGVPAQHDNPLSAINPKDIESITILKDAASTALYGSRGANGVVLVTTKTGKSGKAKISFQGRWGINQVGPYKYDKISDPKDVYEFAWESIYNSARYGVKNGISDNFKTNVKNPNMSHEDAAKFASAHLFNYNGSTDTSKYASGSFNRNALGNWMLYDVPGAIYTPTGAGSGGSAVMSGAYLVNPDGRLNPAARLLYDEQYDGHLLKNNFRQEYNISGSGGTEKMDYFLSLGFLEDPSYIRGSEFERYNGRVNVNAYLLDWLKVGTNVTYSYRRTQSPATRYGRNPGSAVANPFRFFNGQNQLTQLFAHDKDGNIIYENGEKKVHVNAGDTWSPLGQTAAALASVNLLYMLDTDKDVRKSSDITTRTYAEIKFLKDFTFTTNLGVEKYHETRMRYWNSVSGQSNGEGVLGKTFQNVTILNTQQLLNYNRDFGLHRVEGLVGHEFNRYNFDQMNWKSSHELIPEFHAYNNFVGRYRGGTFSNPGGNLHENTLESYLARGSYVYDNKYYAELSARRDGSSKFKYRKDRWGTFWSVGGGWRASSESFMDGTKDWLDNLKLRASYGVIGNQSGISNYSGYQTWSYGARYTETTSGTGTPAEFTLSQGGYPNDALTWENTKTLDIGLDFTLFNRVYGTFDFYNRNTDNAIWGQPIAISLGQSSLEKNTASIQNRGYEIDLGVDIIKNQDFYWNVSVNGTHYTTVLKDVPAGVGSDALDGNWTANADSWSISGAGTSSNVTYLRGVGKDYYNLYIFKYAGVDQETGLPQFYHKVTEEDRASGKYSDVPVGGDVKVTNYNEASRYEVGSSIPDWIGGLSTTLRYKGFDFSAMFAYQIGGKFYSTEYGNGMYRSDSPGRVLSAELLGNTWTPERTDAKFPMAMYGNTYGDGSTFGSWLYTDMALFDASYLNFKNVTLGYTVPKIFTQKYDISALRFYVSADNLFMFAGASGIDPRMSLVGGFEVGAYAYPTMRTVSFGINLDF